MVCCFAPDFIQATQGQHCAYLTVFQKKDHPGVKKPEADLRQFSDHAAKDLCIGLGVARVFLVDSAWGYLREVVKEALRQPWLRPPFLCHSS